MSNFIANKVGLQKKKKKGTSVAKSNLGFEVHTAVIMNSSVFWDINYYTRSLFEVR
jgi:hypothetical protein